MEGGGTVRISSVNCSAFFRDTSRRGLLTLYQLPLIHPLCGVEHCRQTHQKGSVRDYVCNLKATYSGSQLSVSFLSSSIISLVLELPEEIMVGVINKTLS